MSTAEWNVRDPINTITFPLPVPDPLDKDYEPDGREIALKISLFDIKSSGVN
jgi:hypothetical protein